MIYTFPVAILLRVIMLNTFKCILVFSSLLITCTHKSLSPGLCSWEYWELQSTERTNSFWEEKAIFNFPDVWMCWAHPALCLGPVGWLIVFPELRSIVCTQKKKKNSSQILLHFIDPYSKKTLFRKCRSCSLHPLMRFSSADPAFQGHLIKKIIEYFNSFIFHQTIKSSRDIRIEPWLLELCWRIIAFFWIKWKLFTQKVYSFPKRTDPPSHLCSPSISCLLIFSRVLFCRYFPHGEHTCCSLHSVIPEVSSALSSLCLLGFPSTLWNLVMLFEKMAGEWDTSWNMSKEFH